MKYKPSLELYQITQNNSQLKAHTWRPWFEATSNPVSIFSPKPLKKFISTCNASLINAMPFFSTTVCRDTRISKTTTILYSTLRLSSKKLYRYYERTKTQRHRLTLSLYIYSNASFLLFQTKGGILLLVGLLFECFWWRKPWRTSKTVISN